MTPRTLTRRQGILLAVAFVALAVVCSFSFLNRSGSSSPVTTIGPETPGYISRAQLGEAWPLSVDEGVVECLPGRVIIFRTSGATYAVNGTAQGQADRSGWSDIRNLSVPDPAIAGMIKNLQPLLDAGFARCA